MAEAATRDIWLCVGSHALTDEDVRATGNETETEKKAATGMKMSVMAISAETESGQ